MNKIKFNYKSFRKNVLKRIIGSFLSLKKQKFKQMHHIKYVPHCFCSKHVFINCQEVMRQLAAYAPRF